MIASRQRALIGLCAVAALLAASSAAGKSGRVLAEGKPLAGARVCWLAGNAEIICTETEADGSYELMTSRLERIRIFAKGYATRSFAADELPEVVELKRPAILSARLVDGSNGEPIASGELFVVYDAERKVGPFPVNARGVRIRRVLEPGQVRIDATAEGYRPASVEAVALVAEVESTVEIELDPQPPDPDAPAD